MAGDTLFSYVESLQGGRAWGSFLDAGTGSHSLEWILSLKTERWTAITGDPALERRLRSKFDDRMRAQDRIVSGNWLDPAMLHGDGYKTVLADYLLGAIEGFAPYFQDRIFRRLRPLVGETMYLIGLSPYEDPAGDAWGQILTDVWRLRDSCILLAGHRCYREFPVDWVVRSLESSGFEVQEARSFPIRYGMKFVEEQLDVCRRKLPVMKDRELASSLERSIDALQERAAAVFGITGGGAFSSDWVIQARPV